MLDSNWIWNEPDDVEKIINRWLSCWKSAARERHTSGELPNDES